MALKQLKPTSPGTRFRRAPEYPEITKGIRPLKSLTKGKKRISGRNHKGRITIRHRGGGHKRLYRDIDFRRNKDGIPAKVHSIEYDPNRTAHIALLHYADGEKRYILAPRGLKVGATLLSGPEAEPRLGNALPLRAIPLGTTICCIEMKPEKGAQIGRSAGAEATLMAKEGKYAHVRLPSGEIRLIHMDCKAVVGQIGNVDHMNVSYGKAGRRRWLGRRPHTRGVAMNPVDHPMGGGEGKASGGRHPCTPWGKPTKGAKTRRNKRTGKYIVRRRNAGRRRR
ncbi:MAG: 50S ribosomal protein L2 [Acidobacteria bacterium]|nr:50S ribosomal protein L2 [Acidobacteriota bacterium]